MADSTRENPNGIRQPIFLQGCHDFTPADLVPEAGARELRNCEIFNQGTIRRRGGLAEFVSLGTGHTDGPLFLLRFPEQFHDSALVALYNSAPATGKFTVLDAAGTQITMSVPMDVDARTNLVKMLNRVYVLNANHIPLYWEYGNGSLLFERGATTGMPISVCATVFQGRAYAGYKDLLYFSLALGNTQVGTTEFTWDQQFQAFRLHTGDILQVLPFRNSSLLVFCRNGVEALEPNPCDILESNINVLSSTIGCGAAFSPQLIGEDVLFVDHLAHVRSLQQTELDESKGVTNTPLSLAINNVIARVNLEFLHTIRTVVHDGIYWVWYPLDGAQTPNEAWGWSPRNQAWVGPVKVGYDPDMLTTFTVGGVATNQFDGDTEKLYLLYQDAGDTRVDELFALESRTDNGTDIPLRVITRAFAPSPERRKVWNHAEVEYSVPNMPQDGAPQLTISARRDEGGPWTELVTETLVSDAGPALPETLPFTLQPTRRQRIKMSLASIEPSYSLQMRLEITDSTADFRILGLVVTFHVNNIDYDVN